MGAVIVAVALLQTGFVQRNDLASTEVSDLLVMSNSLSRCEETFEVLAQAGVFLAEPSSDGLVVQSALWDQLPQAAQSVIQQCAQELLGSGATDSGVPLIRR
jgi:hypothetical protein